MFAGTAIPGQCELRPPAIKGNIRFWWRALNSHLGLEALHKREGEIFGSSDQDMGRSKFSISVRHELKAELPTFYGKGKQVPTFDKNECNVLDYLAYGMHKLEEKQINYKNECFLPGKNSHFHLDVCYDDSGIMEGVWKAIKAWAEFGGIGSGSRNGWGKVWIENWPKAEVEEPQMLFPQKPQATYTAFSQKSVFFRCKQEHVTWDKALGEVGSYYYSFRKALDGRNARGDKEFKNRVMLSQPIIMNKKDVKEMFLERHSKSMFMGIKLQNGRYVGQILLMPYKYLEKTKESLIREKLKGRNLLQDQSAYQKVYADLANDLGEKMQKVEL